MAQPGIDFSAYITDRTRDFTGREWVFEALDGWLAEPEAPPIFLLTGNPGSGKTAIAARLVPFSAGTVPPPGALARLGPGFLSAVHFCSARDRRWINPHTFTESLALQLAARYPPFAQALAERGGDRQIHIQVEQRAGSVSGQMAGVVIHKLEVGALPAEDAFVRTVREPLEALLRHKPSEPLVLLVDALDEALLYSGGVGIVDLLAGTGHLPGGVRFLLTSRREEAVENQFLDATGLFLSAGEYARAGQEDVQRYVAHRLDGDTRLADQAAALTGEQRSAAVAAIVDGAEGNFLYATFLLAEVADGQRSFGDVGGLPQGLDGLYYDSLARLVKPEGSAWTTGYAPLLGLLSVAQGSLTPGQLVAFTGLSETAVWKGLGRLQQFVQEEAPAGADAAAAEPAYRLYHQSVVDFLHRSFLVRNGRRLRNGYYLPAEPWHRQIAGHYWRAHHPDWQGCDAYGLDSLATHLYHGRQGDRLQELITQEWMAARFRGSGYTHDAFVADVMLAWQAAHEKAQGQIETGQVPAALAGCVRYALIRTSLNSLSANYDPALVVRAVEIGLWPAKRALSVASRVPDPEARAARLAALLATNCLDPEQSTQAQEAGLAAALAIEYDNVHAHALAGLAPQLTGELLERGLAAALAIENEWARAEALAELAPKLRGEALERGLAAVLVIEDEGARARALAGLAPQLTGETLERALAAALAIEYEWSRADALVALVPRFTGEALERGLAVALAIEDEGYRARALARLAPRLEGEALERGLAAALAIGDEEARAAALAGLASQLTDEARTLAVEAGLAAALAVEDPTDRAGALLALAPQLEGEALERALAAALAIGDEEPRALALLALAPQLTGEPLERVLAAVLAIGDEGARAQALVGLVPQLAGEALEEGLAAALAIGDEGARARALAGLAPQLTGEAQSQALAEGLAAALGIGQKWAQLAALAALAPQLTGEALEQGLAAALAIGDEWYRVQALAGLAPQLTCGARAQALGQGLAVALAIEDDWRRAQALVALAPQLTGEALQQGLAAALAIGLESSRAEALAALAAQQTGEALERTLAAALAIKDEYHRARVLTALAPQLTGEALARGLESALALEFEEYRAEALAALAPQLTGKARTQTLEAGLAAALTIRDERARAEALARLAPQLMGEARTQTLEAGLAAALAIGDRRARAEALAWLTPQLTGEARTQTLEEGLAAALAIGDEGARAAALARLAPQLTGESRTQALAEGLAAALAIENEWARAEALAALAPQLTGEALEWGLAAALAIEEERPRSRVLAAFVPVALDPAALRSARQIVADHLKNLSAARREEVLWFCAQEKLFAPPLLDQDTLAAIAGHIVEVCQEWRWM